MKSLCSQGCARVAGGGRRRIEPVCHLVAARLTSTKAGLAAKQDFGPPGLQRGTPRHCQRGNGSFCFGLLSHSRRRVHLLLYALGGDSCPSPARQRGTTGARQAAGPGGPCPKREGPSLLSKPSATATPVRDGGLFKRKARMLLVLDLELRERARISDFFAFGN